ncbi:Endogenous retrovirus group FC1 Env polyprotein [Plecturocebus cupreus]
MAPLPRSDATVPPSRHAKRSPKDVVKKDIGPGSAPVLGHPLDLAQIVNYGTTDNSSCNTTVKLKVYGQAEFQSLLTPPPPVHQNKRAIFLPVVVGLSLASSLVATGIGSEAMGYTVTSAAQLEDKLRVAIKASAASLASLQRQIMSLAQVTLQNQRALNLLTAEKGGTCMFLQEECCYYINELGLVEENINTLRLQEDLRKKQNTGVLSLSWFHPMLTLLTPVSTPIIVICLLLLMAPFLLRFLQTRMREIGRVAVNQMLLHPFVRLSVEAPAN